MCILRMTTGATYPAEEEGRPHGAGGSTMAAGVEMVGRVEEKAVERNWERRARI